MNHVARRLRSMTTERVLRLILRDKLANNATATLGLDTNTKN
jgi:hypothetical protein